MAKRTKAALLMLLASCACNGCAQLKNPVQLVNDRLGMPDDWVGEEIIEDVWNGRTGRNDDFTPESPE